MKAIFRKTKTECRKVLGNKYVRMGASVGVATVAGTVAAATIGIAISRVPVGMVVRGVCQLVGFTVISSIVNEAVSNELDVDTLEVAIEKDIKHQYQYQ